MVYFLDYHLWGIQTLLLFKTNFAFNKMVDFEAKCWWANCHTNSLQKELSNIGENVGEEVLSVLSTLQQRVWKGAFVTLAPGNSKNPKFGAGKHTCKKFHQVSESDRSSFSHLFLLNQAFRTYSVQKIIVWILWEK